MVLSIGISMALGGMLLLSFSKVVEKKIVDAAQLLNGAFHIYLLRAIVLGLAVIFTKTFVLPPDMLYYAITILIGAVAILAFYRAFQGQGIGLPSAVAGAFVPITIVLSILFYGEIFTRRMGFGALLVLVGVFLASVDFKSIRTLRLVKGLPWAFITLVGWGLWFFLIKKIIVSMGTLPATFALEGGIFVAVTIFTLWKRTIRPVASGVWKLSLLSGVLSGAGVLLYYGSIPSIGAALSATIQQVSVVVTAILGFFFFRERFDTIKKIAILVTFVGLLLATL